MHIALLPNPYVARTKITLEALYQATGAIFRSSELEKAPAHLLKSKGEGKKESFQDYSRGMYLSKEILQMNLSLLVLLVLYITSWLV